MANNYISLKVVADKTLRHPMMAGISFEAIIDYAIDFMRIVQCAGFFEERCEEIEIKDYKGLLPDNFYEMNQVRLSTTNNTFRYATDSFHMSDVKSNIDLTYKLQGGYIFTSIKEGTIEISYQAILLDEEGFPLIPDNSKFTRALEAYIKKQWFTILFDMGKLQGPILQNVQQEYAWAVGACETEFQKLNLDKAESFYNSWRTMIPRTNEHSTGFIFNGARSNLKF